MYEHLWMVAAVLFIQSDNVHGELLEHTNCAPDPFSPQTVYDFRAEDLTGANVSLSSYKGKVLLIVNVATYCDSTVQYRGYNSLQTEFEADKFAVLGFPCNQFGLQEPASNVTELLNGLKYVRPGAGFEPNFKMFWKIDVNGPTEHPLYTYLKEACPATRDYFAKKDRLFYDNLRVSDVRWNFEKFLIDQHGFPVMRFDGSVNPAIIHTHINALTWNPKIV